MLDPDDVHLDELAEALDDHSTDQFGHSWWLDPRTGEVHLHVDDFDASAVDADELADPEEAGWLPIETQPSSVGYADMEDFVGLVGDRRARDLLARAIEGRGAFRRFKDTLFEFPELRTEWFAFADARRRRHAIDWLERHDLITTARADDARARHRDPPVGGAAASLPRAVADDLRDLYGARLVDVFVFGSRARGDADDDSDLDLLVVLDGEVEPWSEHRHMDDVMWRHTRESGVVVAALPVSRERLDAADEPTLIRARAEAVPV